MKRSLKTLLALALTLAMLLGNALPVLATTVDHPIAVDDGETCEVDAIITEEGYALYVYSSEQEASATVAGDVSSTGEWEGTVEVASEDSGSAQATIGGDVTATMEGELAVNIHAEDESSAAAEIKGSVSGDAKVYAGDHYIPQSGLHSPADASASGGAEATLQVGKDVDGTVIVQAEDGGTAEATVGEGITGRAVALAKGGSTASLTVEDGGVTAEDYLQGPFIGAPSAVYTSSMGATVHVDITGDIKTDGEFGVYSYTESGGGDTAKTTIIIDGSLSLTTDDIPVGYGVYLLENGKGAETDYTQNGDITVNGEFEASGLEIYSSSGAVVNAALTGDITADSQYASRGVHLSAADSAGINAALTGDISADGQYQTAGLEVEADYNAVITATLTGDISVSSGEGGYCNAIAISNEAATANVLVTGNVTAAGENSAGAYVEAESYVYYEIQESDVDRTREYEGDIPPAYCGTLHGDGFDSQMYSAGTGDEKEYYAYLYDEEDGSWHYYLVINPVEPALVEDTDAAASGLVIEGDVTADCFGIMLDANPLSTADAVVDGTVEGGECSVVLMNNTELGDGVTLTVWEVKPNADGALISNMDSGHDAEYTLTQNKAAEKQLQYIIRVNAEQTDMITAGGAAQEYTAQGKTWKVAHEGETVTLLLQNIPEGYEITGAYGDVDQSVKLEKDAQGNYYLTVPRGGAVELSIVLSKLPDPDPEPEPEPEPEPDPETVAITYILGNDAQYDHIRTTAAVGEGVALQPAPEREGYTFLYWQCTDVDPNSPYYTQPDPDNDFQFRPGAIYTAKKDINFVAVWKQN